MEPLRTGNFSVGGQETPAPQTPKRSSKIFQKFKKIVKKYWYIFSLLIVLIAALITWQVLASNQAAAWDKASAHFEKAEYEQAAALIKNFSLPDDPKELRVYAQTMLATGELDKALKGYEKLYDKTKDSSSKLIMGNIYNQRQEYDKAIKIYREIIKDNPSNTQAYVNIATVYRLQGNNGEAIAIANEAVKANPQNVTLLELRVSMLLEKQDSQEFKDAVAALREVNPSDPLLASLEQQ